MVAPKLNCANIKIIPEIRKCHLKMDKAQDYLFTLRKINFMITNIQMLEGEPYSRVTSANLIKSTSLNMQVNRQVNSAASNVGLNAPHV